VNRLTEIAAKPTRIIVGLNSGTSMDGIDAVCARVEGSGFDVKTESLAFLMRPHPSAMRDILMRAPDLTLEDATRLNAELGESFARAATEVVESAGISISDVDLIGSHGQTVCHLPGRGAGARTATLQLGDLDVIAERTGAVVVGDFRARDAAAGGDGAPLMPYLDWLMFRHRPRTIALNLGGVANLTLVTETLEGCRAFDTGPANLPLDVLACRLTKGDETFDPGGRLAAEGRIEPILMQRLMDHPYLQAPPPKTTGREEFGATFVEELLRRHQHLSMKDILATCCAFVGRSVHHAVTEHLDVPDGVRELVVSGGGVRNLTLLKHLKKAFFPVPVTSSAEYGLDPDAKEAMLFAVLANERVLGRAANVPSATGARWPVGLGKIAL